MEFENKARIAEQQGDYPSAIKYYFQALDALKEMKLVEGLQFDSGNIHNRIANLYTEVGNYDAAIKYFQKASAIYIASDEPLTKVYRLVGECYSHIGAIYLTITQYKLALENFQKAATNFKKSAELEEPILRKYVVERVIFSLALVILCLINLNKKFNEILPMAQKTTTLSNDFKLSGFASNLNLFFIELLNENFAEAHLILQDKIEDAADSTLLPSTLQAAVMGHIMDLARKHIPKAKIRVQGQIIEEKGEVILTNAIFQDMFLYALSFANKKMPPAEWKEVMALVVGKIQKEDVIITEVVPMITGSEVEVGFKEETYTKAAIIDSIAAERDEFIVGWFHTHPGLGLFLSPTDIVNQLGYQSLNPKAIAIIFDFTQMSSGKSGFSFLRLDDPSLGQASNFHSVRWRIKDSKQPFLEIISFFAQFLTTLNNLIIKNKHINLSQLAEQLARSEELLSEMIPQLISLQYLPNTQYNPDTKIISLK